MILLAEFTGYTDASTSAVYRFATVGDSAMPIDVQCIRFAFYADADAVINSFDFTICQFAFDGATLTHGEYALWDLGRKRLAVHQITFPVSSMRRVLKYATQGFKACNGCLAALLRATADNPSLNTDPSGPATLSGRATPVRPRWAG